MPNRRHSPFLKLFAVLLFTSLVGLAGSTTSAIPPSTTLLKGTATSARSVKDSAAQKLEADLIANWHAAVDGILRRDSGKSAAFVMDKGEHALRIRGWLGLNARLSIDVQYFIWSTDNVGRLALSGLLQAANRGVQIRILVDDLMLEKPWELLLAMDAHPNIEIRIYNPNNTLGVGFWKRMWTALTNFRGMNQRMHQKTFIVDDYAAVVGGRNMADEYYDFDAEFDFRDRDVLLAGPVVEQVHNGFVDHWNSALSVPVSKILSKEVAALKPTAVDSINRELLKRWDDTTHFSPEMKQGILDVPKRVPDLLHDMDLCDVRYVHDVPGKNDGSQGLGGGGIVTSALAGLLESAKKEVLIQSPYLILDPKALSLFAALVQRGVKVRISTNSAANNDNHYAVSGYQKQRKKILQAGIEVHELKPHPQNRTRILQRFAQFGDHPPIIVLHAKTAVIDRQILVVGTYNLDPRSQNLNTEAAVIMPSAKLATEAAEAIEQDMLAENSWDAASGEGDRALSLWERFKLWLWRLVPMNPIL